MKNKFFLFILFACSILLVACGSDYEEGEFYALDVGGKFVFVQFGENSTVLTSRHIENGAVQQDVFSTQYIPTKIQELAYNDDYIIASQIYRNESELNYWIVNLQTEYTDGPLSKDEFDELVEELDLKKLVKEMTDMKGHIDNR